MKTQITLPPYFDYLTELPIADLEAELETATKELKEAQAEYVNSSSYGGFKAKQKIALRRKSAASELIKYIKIALKEREND